MRRGATEQKRVVDSTGPEIPYDLAPYIPQEIGELENPQTAIPRIAKNDNLTKLIEAAVQRIPTIHNAHLGDARRISSLNPESVQLVLTSPPYWTLKKYRDAPGQMGHIADYDLFLVELDRVWERCYHALVQ